MADPGLASRNPTPPAATVVGDIKDVHGSAVAAGNGAVALVVGEHGTALVQLEQPVTATPRARPVSPVLVPVVPLRDRTEERAACLPRSYGVPVEICGADGMGKTTLLQHLVTSLRAEPEGTLSMPDGMAVVPCSPAADVTRYADVLYAVWCAFFDCPDLRVRPDEPRMRKDLQDVQAFVLLDDVRLNSREIEVLRQVVPRSVLVFTDLDRQLFGIGSSVELAGLPYDDVRALVAADFARAGVDVTREAEAELVVVWERRDGNPHLVMRDMHVWRTRRHAPAVLAARNDLEAIVAALPAPVPREVLLRIARARLDDMDAGALVDEMLAERRLTAHSPSYTVTDPATAPPDDVRSSVRRTALQVLAGDVELMRDESVLGLAYALLEEAEDTPYVDRVAVARATADTQLLLGRWDRRRDLLDLVTRQAGEVSDEITRGWALHETGVQAYAEGELETARRALVEAREIRAALHAARPSTVTSAALRVTTDALALVTTSGTDGQGGVAGDGTSPPVMPGAPGGTAPQGLPTPHGAAIQRETQAELVPG